MEPSREGNYQAITRSAHLASACREKAGHLLPPRQL